MKHLVYKITNTINNYIYIGVHSTYNINDNYMGSGASLIKAQKEYGIENFTKEILFVLDSREEILEMEAKIVNKDFIKLDNNYNISLGGGKGGKPGYTTARDINGNILYVNTNDRRLKSGELVGIQKGKVTVKDSNNNTFSVDMSDERLISGELVHTSKNLTTVKNAKGETLQVSVSDPRLKSGELVGIQKGKVTVKDKNGNIFNVDKNDYRYISGELVGNRSGSRWMVNKALKLKKSVNSEEVDKYLSEGWSFGRKLT